MTLYFHGTEPYETLTPTEIGKDGESEGKPEEDLMERIMRVLQENADKEGITLSFIRSESVDNLN